MPHENLQAALRKYLKSPNFKSFENIRNAAFKNGLAIFCFSEPFTKLISGCESCPMEVEFEDQPNSFKECLILSGLSRADEMKYLRNEAIIILATTKLLAILESLSETC